jgi:hypothetical protein
MYLPPCSFIEAKASIHREIGVRPDRTPCIGMPVAWNARRGGEGPRIFKN